MQQSCANLEFSLSLTIGIPSYNEGANVVSLIDSIYRSTLIGEASISEIIICDDSSDSTPQIINSFITQNSSLRIKLIHHEGRRGAAAAWNDVFSLASGDIIVLFDADVMPHQSCINELISGMNKEIGLCASNPVCMSSKSPAAKAALFISNWLGTVRKRGISQYTVMGRSLSVRTDIAKKIVIPNETIAIDLYLQCRVLEMGYRILYKEEAEVYFTPPTNVKDFASQVLRSRNGHKQIHPQVKKLGINASPRSVLASAVKTACAFPTAALCTVLCASVLPFYRLTLTGTNSHKWLTAGSSKHHAD